MYERVSNSCSTVQTHCVKYLQPAPLLIWVGNYAQSYLHCIMLISYSETPDCFIRITHEYLTGLSQYIFLKVFAKGLYNYLLAKYQDTRITILSPLC